MQIENHLLKTIFENTPVGIVVLDKSGMVQYVNKYTEHLFSCNKIELIGETLDQFVTSYESGPLWNELVENFFSQDSPEVKVTIHKINTDDIVCIVNSVRIESCDNIITLVFRDVTSAQKAAEQIEKKNLEMAKMNSELIRSNAELKKVSELKSNFLSIASHELKTPLTSIKGYSDIIIDNMRDKLDGGIYRMIESINRAADRLHGVVNNILDVTRIEQKRLRLRPEMLELKTLIDDCIDELSQFTIQRQITFKCHYPDQIPYFYCDKMRMQQVFTNLFSNAIKYSPNESVIDVYVSLEKKNRFHIIVKDHGIGIDLSEQKKIFDPFYEVGNTNYHSTDFSKFLGGGTGLGLSIVKGIVERHGGKIWVESQGVQENEFLGSEFHLLFPVQSEISWDDDETKSLYADEPEISIEDEYQEMAEENVSILLIDSDREAVEISRMVLESVFEIIVADTGETGLHMAFEKRPSVILIDPYLPGLDGYRVCRILRSQEDTKSIPIAFFSAGTQKDEIHRSFICGADDFIVKPFSGKELVEKIWRLLMKKKEVESFR
ncbi:Sensory box histidine kinase [Chitinispirillum alkaliphilum]|nr:Sensory box histidine kinase [Chitinispirillum alkaliphilum]